MNLRYYKSKDIWKRVAEQHGYNHPLEMIKDLYLKGKTMREIGDLFEVTPQAIGQRLKEVGVEARGRGGPNNNKHKDLDINYIVDQYKNGKTLSCIAKELKVTIWPIKQRLISVNLYKPRKRRKKYK